MLQGQARVIFAFVVAVQFRKMRHSLEVAALGLNHILNFENSLKKKVLSRSTTDTT